MSKGINPIQDGFAVSTLKKVSVNGFVLHSRISSKAKGNSYTVQFNHQNYDLSFGYTEMFIQHQNNIYALIRRLQTHEWPVCESNDNYLSDIVFMYGNLQELLGDHIIPVQETDSFVAIDLRDILCQLVCVKMDGSSQMFVCKFPNTIECD